MCKHGNCRKRGRYGRPDEPGRYCIKHRLDDMVDLNKKVRCIEEGCTSYPSYADPGTRKRIYCKTHYKEGMEFIPGKLCKEEGCKRYARCNFPDTRGVIYCKHHMKKGMIDTTARLCIETGCHKHATFRDIEGGKVLYCKEHAKEGAVSRDKTCKIPACRKYPQYSYDYYPVYCIDHKEEGMELSSSKKCICGNIPIVKLDRPYCLKCVPDNGEKIKCELCETSNTKVGKYCGYCFYNLHKHLITIVKHLRKNVDKGLIHNISVDSTYKIPEIYFIRKDRVIMVDLDGQYEEYLPKCDFVNKLLTDRKIPIVFIRFNTSNVYYAGKNISIRLCDRLHKLVDTVKYFLTIKIPDFRVQIAKLFYPDDSVVYRYLKVEDITKIV